MWASYHSDPGSRVLLTWLDCKYVCPVHCSHTMKCLKRLDVKKKTFKLKCLKKVKL